MALLTYYIYKKEDVATPTDCSSGISKVLFRCLHGLIFGFDEGGGACALPSGKVNVINFKLEMKIVKS